MASKHLPAHGDDLDDYGLDNDLSYVVTSPTPPSPEPSKKRKEPDSGLGIEEEVSVQKRVRVPNVKLDEEKLLSPAGIPTLAERVATIKFKGKGHEFDDASQLLSVYQLWLDDLYPKARFADALAMVEKAGHKKAVVTAREQLIDKGKPKASDDNVDMLGMGAISIKDDDDLYYGTPVKSKKFVNMFRDEAPAAPPAATAAPAMINDDVPDDDDWEALVAADVETMDSEMLVTTTTKYTTTAPTASANGPEEEDYDDLDALIAELDHQQQSTKGPDFTDAEEAMREMEGL